MLLARYGPVGMVGGLWLDQAPTSIERIVSNNLRFCCVAVFINEAKVAQARAPFLLRLPPVILGKTEGDASEWHLLNTTAHVMLNSARVANR